uniref:acetylglutamate kinase n=1 Tax=Ananas comosus var. bracteatus TaxID=296719 RepID=A0A6V7QPH0_ANACO|nr:unnamed protein product [Ananas comosus var. bracteatus]
MLLARTHTPPLSLSNPLQNPNPNPSPNPSRGFLSATRLRPPRSGAAALTAAAPASVQALQTPPQPRVDVLSESLPFIQRFRGKTIVVKYGGAAMKSEALQKSVVKDLVLLSCVGLRLVLVHGGGPEINEWLLRVGVEPQFHNGLRVTDAQTMEVVEMVLVGKVNKSLVSLLNAEGATAVGLCGKDARLITARPTPDAAALGFVGEVARVDPAVLRPIIGDAYIPVIATVAADEAGQTYNINADTVAGEIAAAVAAEKLILLTDVPGILADRDDPEAFFEYFQAFRNVELASAFGILRLEPQNTFKISQLFHLAVKFFQLRSYMGSRSPVALGLTAIPTSIIGLW